MSSQIGLVLSSDKKEKIEARFWSYVSISGEEDCWEWSGAVKKTGYGSFKAISYVSIVASRMAWAFANNSDPGDLMVCHACDNPVCCNPSHLWVGTAADNNTDCASKGRTYFQKTAHKRRGAGNPRALISELDILMILSDMINGENNKEISRKYGITHSMVSVIRRGKAWTGTLDRCGVDMGMQCFQKYSSLNKT